MEFLDLGKHCEYSGCHQRDFLPFKCDCCNKTFCLDHRSYRTHECAVAGTRDTHAIKCPVCAGSIRVEGTEDPNAAFARHTKTLCHPERRAARKHKKRCGAEGCHKKLTLTNTVTCDHCRLEVCLNHRYPDAHKCALRTGTTRSGFLSRFSSGAKPKPKPKPKPATARKPKARRGNTDKWGRPVVDPANTLRGTAARRMNARDAQAAGSAAPAPARAPAAAAPAVALMAGAGRGREVCPTCSARFEKVTDLVAHVESWHATAPAAAVATRSAAVTGAGAGVGGGAERPARATPCPRCGAAFYNPVDLVTHCESGQCTQTRRQSSCMVS